MRLYYKIYRISASCKIHYARYPKLEAMPVALISQFDDLVEQLFSNVRDALGRFGR